MQSRRTKEPLPIFILTFDGKVDQERYEIKEMNKKIQIEALQIIPQWKKCQGFRHNKDSALN